MDLIVREAVEADIEALKRLWQACGLVRPWNDPVADITLALNTPNATIFLGEVNGMPVASTMAGFDGHRGWLYYVAVRPDMQGNGYGRVLLTAAEQWLDRLGCPKVELIVREENTAVIEFYRRVGYNQEPRALMSKWLTPPTQPVPNYGPPEEIALTVSYLEMAKPPNRAAVPQPSGHALLSLQRLVRPTIAYYRFLQQGVGDPWLWWSRRAMSDEDLRSIIQDEKVEIYVLSVGAIPAGFIELDFRAMPDTAEVGYFGLMPDFIGRGLGSYLLDWGVRCAWNREPAPHCLSVNTCTLDHPAALAGYQRAGFEIVRREEISFPHPVQAGFIPKGTRILSPGYQT